MHADLDIGYDAALQALLDQLRAEPAAAMISLDPGDNWLAALCDAWAVVAEIVAFYQQRVLEEAFLPTASRMPSIDLLYASLGHQLPPNSAATTLLAYHLSTAVAGVEAVVRQPGVGASGQQRGLERGIGHPAADSPVPPASSKLAGPTAGLLSASGMPLVGTPGGIHDPDASTGTGQPGAATSPQTPAGDAAGSPALARTIPPASQVRAIPAGPGHAPVFVTLAPLDAYVGASRLALATAATAAPPPLTSETTQIELAGVKTGLQAGQPILIRATTSDGAPVDAICTLTSVNPDALRGSTRVAWDAPLGAAAAKGLLAPLIYGFKNASSLVGASAPPWDQQPLAKQLATPTPSGGAMPVRGGLACSSDSGQSWTPQNAGLPVGTGIQAVGSFGDVTIVATSDGGLLRSAGGAPFAPVRFGGGPRRAVTYLGGTTAQMLAGAAGGTVYQSTDLGETWSAVAGGPPTLPRGRKGPVVSNQLPATTVRCVIVDPHDPWALLAGTDSGLYIYNNGAWLPAGPLPKGAPEPNPIVSVPVFDLLAQPDGTILAATTAGVLRLRSGKEGYELGSSPSGLSERVYAVTAFGRDQTLYAATDTGVYAFVDDGWRPAVATGATSPPAGTTVTALLALGDRLLAATAGGVFAGTGQRAALSWAQTDHTEAFTIPLAALDPPTSTQPSPALAAAFADAGIVLDPAASITTDGADLVLTSRPHTYKISRTSTAWQVTLVDALPGATSLAVTASGDVLAGAGPITPVAGDWPGFMVGGHTVEITPQVRTVAAGEPMLIEQRTAAPAVEALTIATVEQDSAQRMGRSTKLTRLTFGEDLEPGRYARATGTVWTGATALAQFVPPTTTVALARGKTVELAAPLAAPVAPGRVATVTGAPPGLAVAVLGGTQVLVPGRGALERVGPAHVDARAIVVDDVSGKVYVASAEGVHALAADGSEATLIDHGWPGGAATAIAATHGTIVAAAGDGVHVLDGAGGQPSWRPAGLTGQVSALAASGGEVWAALHDGSVHSTQAEELLRPHPAPTWTSHPALAGPARALMVSASGTCYAATSTRVLRLDGAAWTTIGAASAPAAVTGLCLAADGTLWAASPSGLLSYRDRRWRADPDVEGAAVAIDGGGAGGGAVVWCAEGLMQRVGTTWKRRCPPSAGAVSGLATAPDGAVWVCSSTQMPLAPSLDGSAAQADRRAIFTGALAAPADLAALDQGAVPQALLEAFADGGVTLDTSHAVVTKSEASSWTIRAGTALYVVAQRSTSSGATLSGFHGPRVVYPTGRATTSGHVVRWPVEVDGQPAVLTAAAADVMTLPAGPDAPALAESATVAEVAPGTTTLTFSAPLEHVYDATTVQVNLNVAQAAQGRPTSVPIGNGDPSKALQSFRVPGPVAAVPQGADPAASSLRIYVDGVRWSPVPKLRGAGPQATVYVQQDHADGSATVTFGDGADGARLPAGVGNVVATYLEGGGAAGEVSPGALIQPLNRQRLVRSVHNPMAALVAPSPSAAVATSTAVRTMDRIVTLSDYEDAAVAHPGVAQATAELAGGPRGRAIVLSAASVPGAPAGWEQTLQEAVGTRSASGLAVRVVPARAVPVALTLRVVSSAPVAAAVRKALHRLTPERPGMPLLSSKVVAQVQDVPGVVSCEIVAWGRAGQPEGPAASLPCERASWPAAAAAPRAAELLMVDAGPRTLRLETVVVAP